jgi:hypothetical protein
VRATAAAHREAELIADAAHRRCHQPLPLPLPLSLSPDSAAAAEPGAAAASSVYCPPLGGGGGTRRGSWRFERACGAGAPPSILVGMEDVS